MKLNPENYFRYLIFHPLQADTHKQQAAALIASVACAIFTLGICHATCALRNHLSRKQPSGKGDVTERATKLGTDHLPSKAAAEKTMQFNVSQISMPDFLKDPGVPENVISEVIKMIAQDEEVKKWLSGDQSHIHVSWSNIHTPTHTIWKLMLQDSRYQSIENKEPQNGVSTELDALIMQVQLKGKKNINSCDKQYILHPLKGIKTLTFTIADKE